MRLVDGVVQKRRHCSQSVVRITTISCEAARVSHPDGVLSKEDDPRHDVHVEGIDGCRFLVLRTVLSSFDLANEFLIF